MGFTIRYQTAGGKVQIAIFHVKLPSAVNLKGIWPRLAPSALAVHAAGGLGAFFSSFSYFFFLFFVVNLAEAAASMQFTAALCVNK